MKVFTLVSFLLISTVAAMAQPIKNDQEIIRVSVFPNPASDYLHIRMENPDARQAQVHVYSIIGSEISTDLEFIDDYEMRIRVKDLPSGYYLLSVQSGENSNRISRKFIKR